MKQRLGLIALAALGFTNSAVAQTAEGWHAHNVGEALGYSALFGVVGLIMVIIGFKVFDKLITRIDLEEEIKKGNIAAAILSAAAIIGISIIIAASMS